MTSSGLPRFRNSALTRAALRGGDYLAHNHSRQRLLAACQAARQPGLTYLYIRDVDKVGHHSGWEGEEWVAALEATDAQLAELHRRLPAGTLTVIVADHGMVEADPDQRIDIAQDPELSQDVRLVGGEPRAVMLYLDQGADPQVVSARWHDRLGERAWVLTRDQAIQQGVFGPVDPRIRPMIGDLLILAGDRVTLVTVSYTHLTLPTNREV